MYDFLHSLSSDTTILTPNQRLRAHLLKAYEEKKCAEDKKIWPTPSILPLNAWLQLFYEKQLDNGNLSSLLLTGVQEEAIWKEIILENELDYPLLHPQDTAKLAQKAWELLSHWQVDLDVLRNHPTEDTEQFIRWCERFKKYCEENHFISTSQLLIHLGALSAKDNIESKNLILFGFHELTPLQANFFQSLENNGFSIQQESLRVTGNTVQRHGFMTQEEEIRAMATWAKHLYAEDTSQTIACIVPQLVDCRWNLERIFTEIFYPHHLFFPSHKMESVNISGGEALSNTPLVKTAFELLFLSEKNVSNATLTELLLTPYLGYSQTEKNSRLALDIKVKKSRIKNISFSHLPSLLRTEFSHCTHFHNMIKNLKSFKDKTLSHQAWAISFAERLTDFGWPGEKTLESGEYQVLDSWRNLLNTFVELDVIDASVSYEKAIEELKHLADIQLFQTKTPFAPIQVLGLLEGAGIYFDNIWIMGLHDDAFPAQAAPNPFIPYTLQREKNMAHASYKREYEFAKTMLEGFSNSTPNLIVSYPQQKEDIHYRPSPLIEKYEETDFSLTSISSHLQLQNLYPATSLEYLKDDVGPSIAKDEKIRGGSGLFKAQAACAFQSFAQYRLQAEAFEKSSQGFDALDKGNIIHSSLQQFWADIKNSDTLKTLSDAELQEFLKEKIQYAVKHYAEKKGFLPTSNYAQLEIERCLDLILTWIEVEKTREPFQVLAVEKALEVTFEDLPLSLRMDRIDEIFNKGTLIIDYKTGSDLKISQWEAPRPLEPQLPLYAITASEHISGIAFAQVNPKFCGYKALGDNEDLLENIKYPKISEEVSAEKNWELQKQLWHESLGTLAKEFKAGDARRNPKHLTQTCNRCAYGNLCRIQPETLQQEGGDEDE